MDKEALALASGLVPKSYISQSESAFNVRRRSIKSLLSQRCMPAEGWDEASIEHFLHEVAMMDSNNFPDNVGVGEREGRVASSLVKRRHFNMSHGIGRSGDIAAVQPKAAGSSLIAKLTNLLVKDALRVAGMADISNATVLPLATGMAITMVLLSLKQTRPPTARYVIWPRIDQKTCAKCVVAAGLELLVIPMVLEGDQLCTNVGALEARIKEVGPAQVVAVLSTTSCFAPRAADDLVAIAKLCAKEGIGHVVNNAYGVQARQLCSLIASAWRKGRVDAVVQSTDKNFMVPVGGSVVAAGPGKSRFVDDVNAAYPGRAAASPMLDLLITLLHWGVRGWQAVLKDREELYVHCQHIFDKFATKHRLRLLRTPGNPISLALSLDGLLQGDDERTQACAELPLSYLGSMLFHRRVSGTRVICQGSAQKVAGVSFEGYGSHHDAYPHSYITFAAALGTTTSDVQKFVQRLEAAIQEFQKQRNKCGKEQSNV